MDKFTAVAKNLCFALACYQASLEACREFGKQINVAQEESMLLRQIATLCERTKHKDLAIAYYLDALEKLQHPQEKSSSCRHFASVGAAT